jgi:hypothetical protein
MWENFMPIPDRNRQPMISPAEATAMATVTPTWAPLSKAFSSLTGVKAFSRRMKLITTVTMIAISPSVSSL